MVSLRQTRGWEAEEVRMFRDSLRRFLEVEAVPNDERWRKQKRVDREFWEKAATMGFLCPSMPEEYGGGGGDFRLEAVVSEELGYANITSFGQQIHGPIVAHYILHNGTEAQRQRWLPKMCSGEMIAALAMTEPGAGSDLQGLRTTARRDGDEYVINGSKIFITNGHNADLILVACKTDLNAGARGISLVVVETKDLPGFRRGRNLEKIGMHGSDTAELFFDDVRVPADNLLGCEEGKGFYMMMQELPQERLVIAAGAQATMERAVELTIEYTNDRKAFGKRLLDMQLTRQTLAECYSITQISRAFLDQCIVKHTAGELSAMEASMAKYWCTDKENEVVDKCLQLHGGYGYMNEYPIARMFVDARVQRIYGGTNEIMKEVIARSFS